MYVDAPADPRPAVSEGERNSVFDNEKTQQPHLDFYGSEMKTVESEKGMETPQQNEKQLRAKHEVNSRTLMISKRQTRPGLPEARVKSENNDDVVASALSTQSSIINSEEPSLNSDKSRDTSSSEQERHHVRRDTVVVENSSISEIKKAFNEIREMKDIQDPITELERRMTALFYSKELEFNAQLIETENRFRADLNICNLKLRAANEVSSKAEKFLDTCRQRGIDIKTIVSPDGAVPTMSMQNSTNSQLIRKSPQQQQLVQERDSLRDDLNSLENNYSELFKRYEKMRENCTNLKTNEEALKERIESLAKTKEEIVNRYYELRDHAHDQLKKANTEIARLIKQHDEDTLGLRLGLKQKEAQVTALQATLDSKTKENSELAQICEELIKKSEMMDSRSD
uniref:Transforming acidic coiled-coil-containing protein C-terminal domain-containing protein n=1 Tax=Acrobeloides nanus TaxID=290746 RepID=A0A914DW70_9BILA